jgi:hypothetical protein
MSDVYLARIVENLEAVEKVVYYMSKEQCDA